MSETRTEYIYVLNLAEERLHSPDGWTEKDNKIVGIHFKYITELYEKGVVKYVGRTVDERSSFGIVVFEAGSEDEAREIMENDPALINGLMTAKVYPFKTIYK